MFCWLFPIFFSSVLSRFFHSVSHSHSLFSLALVLLCRIVRRLRDDNGGVVVRVVVAIAAAATAAAAAVAVAVILYSCVRAAHFSTNKHTHRKVLNFIQDFYLIRITYISNSSFFFSFAVVTAAAAAAAESSSVVVVEYHKVVAVVIWTNVLNIPFYKRNIRNCVRFSTLAVFLFVCHFQLLFRYFLPFSFLFSLFASIHVSLSLSLTRSRSYTINDQRWLWWLHCMALL